MVVLFGYLPIAKCKIANSNGINSKEHFVEYTKLAIYMAKRFIGPKTNTLVINEKCKIICNEEQNYQTELLNNIIYGIKEEFTIQLFLGHYNDRLWDYNMFIVDSHESFLILRYKLPSTWQERFFNFFILLTWSSNNEVELNETLYKIFKTASSFNVRNVVIMCKAFNGDYISFYAYEILNKNHSQNNITVREINRYENGTLMKEFLFPDHVNDYNSCWLNVSAHITPPLLIFNGDVNNETHLMEINRLGGIEGDILKAIAKSLNLKIRLHFPKEENIINFFSNSEGCFRDSVIALTSAGSQCCGYKSLELIKKIHKSLSPAMSVCAPQSYMVGVGFSNYCNLHILSFTSSIYVTTTCKDLDKGRSHIAIGGFSSTQWNSDKYSKSFVYHTTPYVFVIRSGLCFGPIKQLLNPLCPSTWTFLLILFSLSFIFSKLIHNKPKLRDFVFGSKNKTPICSMFTIFFGNSLPIRLIPTRNFPRFLMAAWLLLSFEVRNGYQGKMFDSLRFSQRIPMPQTISQLIEQDYTLLTHVYNDFYPVNKTQIMANTTRRMNMLQMSTLKLTSTALLDSLAHYNYKNCNTSTLTYIGETIHSFPCVMYFKKHSMLRQSIDRKLKIFSDAGITAMIARRYVRTEFLKMNTRSEFVSQLTNINLKGLYLISGVMFLISTIVFILELLTRKSQRLKKLLDFLNSF
ncbi:hypothetical protein FF38_02449 [Lucilia cuprina]|uniref:Putative ionotropic receptor ligand binding domain-containing protein n=1 Tax=Lucilia cuprina TaxID=7375 RepID=A0A0L0CAP6_LUCCU|nr:hypothetical protein FF38_02449 [Lucilia cuprina]